MEVGSGFVNPEIQGGVEIFGTVEELIKRLLTCTRHALQLPVTLKQLLDAVFIERNADMTQARTIEGLITVVGQFGVFLRQVEQFIEVWYARACYGAG